ncbi:glutamine amidotransferase [Pseudarthrobacter sp. PS3-L1]|uniref:glutamine amidotransferase n=1 Tax=Pseudarthrobacter sp. PS3-L1 TaxID=3046207 RepID=UPI0024B950BE|nr:glutamine amidotransferase [Pseudarthrobacter sp. PS3-L1]MDJ0319686.1 glutamine amidotransferase [Pseudarthrobacter sp. PS3-L1]
MLPFLLIGSRPEDLAADEEYQAYLAFCGLEPEHLIHLRLEAEPSRTVDLESLDLRELSGIIVGGSPFTSTDPQAAKPAVQVRVERELASLLDRLVPLDFPFFGACYGVGTLGTHQGAIIDRTFGEELGAVAISLTPAGLEDPVLAGLSPEFLAFTGHKEACSHLPSHAVLLAGSPSCPVQMFRIGANMYATQFHPELDVAGLETRIEIYQHAGYFPAGSAAEVTERVRLASVTEPMAILRNFAMRYARTAWPT